MSSPDERREIFSSRLGGIVTMLGVAVGLGNVWRFPYMAGTFGGASFVLFYILVSLALGIPALMAEWTLGRHTRRGPAGAFSRAGLRGGRFWGFFFFVTVAAAMGYYTNVVGWVLYFTLGEIARGLGFAWDSAAVQPPAAGFAAGSLVRQLIATGLVLLACVWVLLRGLRAGIERVSVVLIPLLYLSLIVLIVRAVTLPGAAAGIDWYLLKFEPLTATVAVTAIGQAIFSLSLGGTFMVVYGSYLPAGEDLHWNAVWTAGGDLLVGILAGFAIFPAVFAFGLEPAGGPGLLFSTLPQVFTALPLGWFFGLLFFLGLLGAGYLSDVAAFEVLVAGLTDNTRLSRRQAVWLLAVVVFVLAVPTMVNHQIFFYWDLTFGSGVQTLGALMAVITVGWCLDRAAALRELGGTAAEAPLVRWLYFWLRWVIPGVLLAVGGWWLVSEVLA